MGEHTKEPWRTTRPASIERPPGIAAAFNFPVGDIFKTEDARRIVACVNFCAGTPTAVLEAASHNTEQETINATHPKDPR